MGTGLLPALKQLVLLAGNLITARQQAMAAAPPLPRMDVTQPPFSYVDQLGRMYLAAGLESLSTGRLNEDSAFLATFASLNLTATLLCIIALLLFYLVVYRPLFARLDRDIKSTRGLLLLLSGDAVRAVPAVLTAGKKLLASQ